MLKHRLLFGSLMVVIFSALAVIDGWLDGSLTATAADKPVQGTILCVLISLLAVGAQFEMSALANRVGAVFFKPVAIIGSILLATSWYWRQFFDYSIVFQFYYVVLVAAFALIVLLFYQAVRLGVAGTIVNCAVNYFAIFYLGFLASFVVGIRVDFGLWAMLMFIFTVKASDIGAYTIGRIFGKHKFSPSISPGKTWEGLSGAIVFGAITAVAFSVLCDIMAAPIGICFGAVFGVLGQLGDLAESMIKRDAQKKDSADSVPGFGGLLDVIDSPIATAPAAYVFFMLAVG